MPSVWDYLTASPAGVAAPEQERRTITGSVADFFGVEPIRLEGQHRRISEQAERRDTEARQLFLDDLSTTIPEHAAPAFLLPARERQRLTDMVREGYRETFGGDPGDEELGNFNRQFAVRSNTRHLQQMARAHERDLGDASEWVIDHASALALAGGPVTRIAGLPAIGLQAVKDWVKQRDLTGAVERFQRGEPTEQDMTQLARTIAANDRAYGAGIGQRLFDAIADTAAYAGQWRAVAGGGAGNLTGAARLGALARGAAATTAVRTPGAIARLATPELSLSEDGDLEASSRARWGNSLGSMTAEAITGQAIESATETLGGEMLNRLGRTAGSLIRRIPVPQRGQAIAETLGNVLRMNPGQGGRQVLQALDRTMRRINPEYQGLLTELGEERLNDIAQGLANTGDWGIIGQATSGRAMEAAGNQLLEAAALGIFSLGAGGAGMIQEQMARNAGRQRMQADLRAQGMSEPDIQRAVQLFEQTQNTPAPQEGPEEAPPEAQYSEDEQRTAQQEIEEARRQGVQAAPGATQAEQTAPEPASPVAEAPAQSQTAQQPTEVIDRDWFASRFTTAEGLDMQAAGDEARARIAQAVADGKDVTLIVEGKRIPLNGNLVDREGKPWGILPVLQPLPGNHDRIEISARPAPSAPQVTQPAEPTPAVTPPAPPVVQAAPARELGKREQYIRDSIRAAIQDGETTPDAIVSNVLQRPGRKGYKKPKSAEVMGTLSMMEQEGLLGAEQPAAETPPAPPPPIETSPGATAQAPRTAAYAPEGPTPQAQPASARQAQATQEPALNSRQIIFNLSRLWDVLFNTARLGVKTRAITDRHTGAVTVNQRHAGNAPAAMHEIGHVMADRKGVFPDTWAAFKAKAGAQVAAGLLELDYDPKRTNLAQGMHEGYAEYFRMWTTNQLPTSVTPNMKEAIAWIESTLTNEDRAKLEISRRMFEGQAELSATERAAQFLNPELQNRDDASLSPAERAQAFAAGYLPELRARWEDDLILLRRAEEARMKGGWKPPPGMRPSEILQANRFATDAAVELMIARGIYTIRFDPVTGNRVRQFINDPLKELLAPLLPEDLKAMSKNQPSRFDTFAIARHILDEVARGREPVPEDQVYWFQQSMDEMKKDHAFMQRATRAADNLTAAFNSTRESMVMAEIMDPKKFAQWKEAHPTYQYLGRIVDPSRRTRGKGGVLPNRREYMRMGPSGLEIIPPIEGYLMRLRFLASLLVEHQVRLQVRDMAKVEISAPFMRKIKTPMTVNKVSADQIAAMLTEAEIDEQMVEDVRESLGDEVYSYFTPGIKGNDGRLLYGVYVPQVEKAETGMGQPMAGGTIVGSDAGSVVVRMPDGTTQRIAKEGLQGETTIKPEYYEFERGQESLYYLLTHQQESELRAVLEGLGPFGWAMRQLVKLTKFGAVSASHVFQAYNIFPWRDPATFFRNSGVPLTFQNVAELAKEYVRFYVSAFNQLIGKAPTDTTVTAYQYGGAEINRPYAFDAKGVRRRAAEIRGGRPTLAGRTVDYVRTKGELFLKLLGAGENAPRALAMRKYLESHGYTVEEIKKRAEAAPDEDAVPWNIMNGALIAAQEATVPYSRVGSKTRELNKYLVFAGAWQSSMSKYFRTWKSAPQRAGIYLGALMAFELLHWLLFRDEPWYDELRGEQSKFWYMQLPDGTTLGLPKPLDIDASVGNTFRDMLHVWEGADPQFALTARDFAGRLFPPSWLPPPGPTALDLLSNTRWSGDRPIVPERVSNIPAWEKLTRYQAPYAADQLTGGLLSNRTTRVPFIRQEPRGSINDLYQEIERLEGLQELAREDSQSFAERKQLLAMQRFTSLLAPSWEMTRQATGAERLGLQQFQLAVAQVAQGREPQYNPFTRPEMAPAAMQQPLRLWRRRLNEHAMQRVNPQRQAGESVEDYRERARQQRESVEAAREVLRLIRR